MLGHTPLGAQQSPHPSTFLTCGKGSLFLGFVPPCAMVNSKSVVSIKPGHSGVVIGYQVDKFTHTWLQECFVAQSHIYCGFTSKESTPMHFPLNQGVKDFWTKQLKTLSMVLIPSSLTPLKHQNWMHPLMNLIS